MLGINDDKAMEETGEHYKGQKTRDNARRTLQSYLTYHKKLPENCELSIQKHPQISTETCLSQLEATNCTGAFWRRIGVAREMVHMVPPRLPTQGPSALIGGPWRQLGGPFVV